MRKNYVLIDFENTQPDGIKLLYEHDVKIIAFIGDKQSKIPFEFVEAMQPFGDRAEYVRIEGTGPNALDFHIAFYMGRISATDPSAYFHIISKDKGFDPLLKHLKTKKICALRENSISEIPLVQGKNLKTNVEKVDHVVKYLISRGNAKPRTLKTLANSIHSLFGRTLTETELNSVTTEMIQKKLIIEKEGKVTYALN